MRLAKSLYFCFLIHLNMLFIVRPFICSLKDSCYFPWRLISKFFSPLCQHRISRTVSTTCSKATILQWISFTIWLGTYWNFDSWTSLTVYGHQWKEYWHSNMWLPTTKSLYFKWKCKWKQTMVTNTFEHMKCPREKFEITHKSWNEDSE